MGSALTVLGTLGIIMFLGLCVALAMVRKPPREYDDDNDNDYFDR